MVNSLIVFCALSYLQDIKTSLNLNSRRERDKEKSAEIAQGLCLEQGKFFRSHKDFNLAIKYLDRGLR